MDAGGGRGLMALWYLTRGTGAVALVLLTASVVLGIANVQRLASPRFPRFVVDGTHRTVSLLVLALLVVHIATTLIDGYAPVGIADVVIPFGGAYRPLWLGFGALALDLLLAVTVTSLLRARLGLRAWRAVHWLAYACWPIALIHGLGTGSDVRAGWLTWLSLACAVAVVAAVLVRLTDPAASAGLRAGVVGALLAATVAVAVWLPSGPLAAGWSARAGTPTGLLGGRHAAPAAGNRGTP
jgi:methionine sulfoxide reductase heme-binding subunit